MCCVLNIFVSAGGFASGEIKCKISLCGKIKNYEKEYSSRKLENE